MPYIPSGPRRDGDDAGARDFDQAERQHQVDEAFDLVGSAGDLEHEAFVGGVDDAGAEGVGKPQRLHAVLAFAAHLDHGELALQRRTGRGQIDDAVHRHQPVELILDLLDHHRRAAGDDGDARQVLLVLGLGDGERVRCCSRGRRTARSRAPARPARCRPARRACGVSTPWLAGAAG